MVAQGGSSKGGTSKVVALGGGTKGTGEVTEMGLIELVAYCAKGSRLG